MFGLVEFLVCRKLLFLKLLLFQIITQKANICMWSIELKWYHKHGNKVEHYGINTITLQQEVDAEINF